MEKTVYDIILKPIVTEKSMVGMAEKKYTFKVAKTAGKIEIARAVEEIFGVNVKSVNTISMKGRAKRVGTHAGYKPDWKKAIVTLTEKSKTIEFFEGMM